MKKLLAILAAASLILSTFAGCGSDKNKDKSNSDNLSSGSSLSDDKDGSESKDSSPSVMNLKATKVCSLGQKTINFSKGGFYYKTDDSYGIISLDGVDSGAVYSYCDYKGKYFEISKAPDLDVSKATNFNIFGLVDGNGKALVPAEYSFIDVIGDRYAVAYKADDFSSDVNKVLFNIKYDNNTYYFTGEWKIFDLSKCAVIAGANGTKDLKNSVYGDVIKYKTDDGIQHILNGKGQTLSNDVSILENGSYYNKNKGDMISLFDANGSNLFDLEKESFSNIYAKGEYYILSEYKNDEFIYSLLDKDGKKISAEFEDLFDVKGNFIFSDEELYTFDGKQVIDGDFDSVSEKEGYILLKDNKDFTLLDSTGKVVEKFNGAECNTDPTAFTFVKKIDDENYVYSFKDKDFIKGKDFTFGTAIVKEGENEKLINTFTGETLIEEYEYFGYPKVYDDSVYVEAHDSDYNSYLYNIK